MKKFYEDLSTYGVNIENVMDRFMNNEDIYERFLKKFLDDPNYKLLEQSLIDKNYEDALSSSHTLKGVCGNLGMDTMFKLLEKMVADIRAEDYSNLDSQFEALTPNYNEICGVIRSNFAE